MEDNNVTHFVVSEINFHPVLKDIENIFWLFLLSIRTLSDIDIQKLLRKKNNSQVGYQSFNQMLDKFNKNVDLHIVINSNQANSKMNIFKEMVFLGKAMSILSYDYLTLSKYNILINKDNEFKFLKHIRNGSAHNNKFNLKDEDSNWKIDENEEIVWHSKKINRELHGKTVFNDFISLFDIFLLVKYFSEKLYIIDQSKIK